MGDELPFTSPNLKPPPRDQPKPGELLIEFRRDIDLYTCELGDHSEFGVEAQFLLNGHLYYARTFRDDVLVRRARDLAIACANKQRAAREARTR
jgi:hypothetical protein